jgi:hypothetical protein
LRDRDPSDALSWIAVVAMCSVATLATPFGWTLWRFMLETVGMTRPAIEDWQPLWGLAPHKWIPWLASVLAGVWAVSRAGERRLPLAVVLAMLAYASLRVARIAPLFVGATAVLISPLLIRQWPDRRSGPAPRSPGEPIVAACLFAACLALSAWIASSSLSCIAIDDNLNMPDRSTAQALHDAERGRLVTFFNWGQYALWHFGPDLRVSMDGRREQVYSDARLAEHDAILYGAPAGFQTLERWQAEYVWLPAMSGATKRWLQQHGYRIDVESDRSFIAVRVDLPRLDRVRMTSGNGRGCFPG